MHTDEQLFLWRAPANHCVGRKVGWSCFIFFYHILSLLHLNAVAAAAAALLQDFSIRENSWTRITPHNFRYLRLWKSNCFFVRFLGPRCGPTNTLLFIIIMSETGVWYHRVFSPPSWFYLLRKILCSSQKLHTPCCWQRHPNPPKNYPPAERQLFPSRLIIILVCTAKLF